MKWLQSGDVLDREAWIRRGGSMIQGRRGAALVGARNAVVADAVGKRPEKYEWFKFFWLFRGQGDRSG